MLARPTRLLAGGTAALLVSALGISALVRADAPKPKPKPAAPADTIPLYFGTPSLLELLFREIE